MARIDCTHDEPTRNTVEIKTRIVEHARRGAFDRNPLLSTVHDVACPHCRHRQPTRYLDALKVGTFTIKPPEETEVYSLLGPMDVVEQQVSTPLVISLSCQRCDHRIETMPTSVEYLLVMLERVQVADGLYA
jgi:uncharacterized protein YlaI